MNTTKSNSTDERQTLRIGSIVIVKRNPHDCHAQPVVGRVVAERPAEGIDGADLFDVEYRDSATLKTRQSPFHSSCLEFATRSALLTLAARAHQRAAELLFLAQAQRDEVPEATTSPSLRDML